MENTTFDWYQEKVSLVSSEIRKLIVGQKSLIDHLLVALLSNGHVILEGVPGLAKTLSIQSLTKTLDLDFKRISFTPDLLPGDLIGGQIYNQAESKFYVKKGPIFTNFLLADEINRAPSKVQSALLEAMQERKVTIGDETYSLSKPFFVFATQNPIEQEGTYNLPEAQLDRFLMKVIVDYPSEEDELTIMKSVPSSADTKLQTVMTGKQLMELQGFIEKNIFVDEKIYGYIKDIIFATRYPERYSLSSIREYLSYGASPRASIGLVSCTKALAFLSGREFVIPDDVKVMAYPILRHRLGLSYSALGDDVTTDHLISRVLDAVNVP